MELVSALLLSALGPKARGECTASFRRAGPAPGPASRSRCRAQEDRGKLGIQHLGGRTRGSGKNPVRGLLGPRRGRIPLAVVLSIIMDPHTPPTQAPLQPHDRSVPGRMSLKTDTTKKRDCRTEPSWFASFRYS